MQIISDLYYAIFHDDHAYREYSNGVWFWLGTFMWLAVAWRLSHLTRRVWGQVGRQRRFWTRLSKLYIEFTGGEPNAVDAEQKAAISDRAKLLLSVLFYLAGSVGRAGWNWVYWNCVTSRGECQAILDNFWFLAVCSTCAIIGGACFIRVVMRSTAAWMVAVVVTLWVPAWVALSDFQLISILRFFGRITGLEG